MARMPCSCMSICEQVLCMAFFMSHILVFDLGATSGRGIVCRLENQKISIVETHRFSNDPVTVSSTLYWDVLRIFHEMKQIIKDVCARFDIKSISVDSWGVDFALLDADGVMLENPVHYRDGRTDGIKEQVFELVPPDKLYGETGIQIMDINTIFQLYYLAKNRPDMLSRAETLLFIPDLLNYFLTGQKRCEYTIASTSQLLSGNEICADLLDTLGLDSRIFEKITPPGTVCGNLSPQVMAECFLETAIPVVTVCGHDTACAVAAVPSQQDKILYLSCGTWSLLGTQVQAPIISQKTMEYNLTNEGAYGFETRLLKNIMGLWLVSECLRYYSDTTGQKVTYSQLEQEARREPAGRCFIDPDDPVFLKPGDMPNKICEYVRKQGGAVPQNRGQIIRCIYESLARKYKLVLDQLENVCNTKFERMNIIGGGGQDSFLCQLTANATGIEVHVGPTEASALGNAVIAYISLGLIEDISEGRRIVENSSDILVYRPL